jgi:hypothetical protein
MTIARAVDGTDSHGTSASTTAVTLASGPPDGAQLLAVLFQIVQQTPSGIPAGWTLLATQNAGSNAQSLLYGKVAASEGTTPTYQWTLPSATKSGLWVGAYTGVDTTAGPTVAAAAPGSGTSLGMPSVAVGNQGWLISCATCRHAATGSASSFTLAGDSERLDFGSNVGSGSDISAFCYDAGPLSAGSFARTVTASQTEGQIAALSIALPALGAPSSTLAGRWGIHL